MEKVVSKDGTAIAFERSGKGPALVLVDGALCSRAFGPMPKLAPLLAREFTVFMYDRRGRGESGNVLPYSKAREVEDIGALINAAGGSAFLLGLSSGAALALEAAASGLNVKKVAAYEPPYIAEKGTPEAKADHQAELERRLAAGRRGDALKYFLKTMVRVPSIFVLLTRLMPGIWRKLEAVAHTLPYDAAVMGDFTVPAARLASVRVPTLAMDGGKTDARLKRAVRAVAEAVPGAQHRTLPDQTHNVKPEALAPVVAEFFRAESAAERVPLRAS